MWITRYLLSSLLFGLLLNQDLIADAPGSLQERAEKAVELLKETYSGEGPGVAYLISRQGEVLASGGIGKANLEWDIPITDTTVFRLGSISKSITAVAVLQLVEQGKIELDQPISTYAPDLPPHMGDVTMRQLLSHRSGLDEHAFDESLLPFIWQPMTTDKIIELQKDKARTFKAGTEYAYVNFNYVLVAHVIEKITGQPFVEYANKSIFAANGMHNSYYDENSAVIKNRAEFYDEHDSLVTHAADIDMSHASAAGALLSSVHDMAHWFNQLTDGKLISQESLAEAWAPQPLPNGKATEYGLGFNNSPLAGHTIIWHTGLTPGSQSAFDYAPDSGIFIILLSNGFHLPRTGRMVDDMMKLMLATD